MAEKRQFFTSNIREVGEGAVTSMPRPTGNAVFDREANLRDENGVPKREAPYASARNNFGGMFTPPVEAPDVAALKPSPALNPALLPATQAPGLGGLAMYNSNIGAMANDTMTLFYPPPPNNVQMPRAIDSQNLMAQPPRFTMSSVYRIFSKPRKGTPGYNPGGVNTTATP